jgi:uracil-DNA glycosylase family 4
MEVMQEQISKYPGARCWECPLQKKPMAPTQGPKDSDVILVSRSPGFHEAMAGIPFSGPSGKVLDHLLKQNGVTRNEIRITNTVLCAPDAGKVPPDAIVACRDRLKREIKTANLVIACGSEAVNEIIGRGSIDSYRGYRIRRGNKELVAANNPALVLHDDSMFPNLVRDFKRAFNPIPEPKLPEVTLFREEKDCIAILASMQGSNDLGGEIAVDIETRGGLSQFSSLVSIQFSTSGNKAIVLGEPGIVSDSSLRYLKQLLESSRRFIYHNGKFDVKVLRTTYGINARVDEDTLLLSYVLDERSGGDDLIGVHGLEYLLMEEFGWPKYESENVRKFKKNGIVQDWQEFSLYAGFDVAGTKQLYNLYRPQVRADVDLEKAYTKKLIPGSEVVTQMELCGMIYDIEAAADILENDVNPELLRLREKIRDISGDPLLNPNSPQQLAVLFYDKWKIQHAMRKRPDMNRSVDDTARTEILEGRYTCKENTPVEAFVKEYDRSQKLSKQANTYLKALITKAENDPANQSRVYTEFLLHGTNSGRPSARNPNLLNITRSGRHESIPDIRKLFRSSPGRQFVSFDYSQAELRCIACMSGDKELTRVYADALDLHNLAAENFYGKDYTNENRQSAKNMNFGVAYRQTAETFQEKHGIPKEEAAKFIKWWWNQFSGVAEWERQIEIDIRTKGVLTSPFGRKKRFHLLTRENINASYREGINFYPQSAAADLTLASCIEISRNMDRRRAALCLTVYDSILADVEEDYIDTYRSVAKQIMESRAKDELGWKLPFLTDSGIGDTWGTCK